LNTPVLDQSCATQERLARIDDAAWHDYGFGSYALVATDDGEVLVLLSLRFKGYAREPGVDADLYVVDSTDRCYVGLDKAKDAAIRDLRAAAWSDQ
jgi:hypothetical protein